MGFQHLDKLLIYAHRMIPNSRVTGKKSQISLPSEINSA